MTGTLPRLRIADASPVTAELWIGGDLEIFDADLALEQLHELDAAGLTDIVDLRLEWDDSEWVTMAKPHIQYCWLGVDDAGQRMPDRWFHDGVEYVLARLHDRDRRVLVHCHMGINRGPSMGYAILLALGWDPIAALDAIRAARPIAYIAYAEDALDWWLRSSGATATARRDAAASLAAWRRGNHLDVGSVIRAIRREEDRKRYGDEGS